VTEAQLEVLKPEAPKEQAEADSTAETSSPTSAEPTK